MEGKLEKSRMYFRPSTVCSTPRYAMDSNLFSKDILVSFGGIIPHSPCVCVLYRGSIFSLVMENYFSFSFHWFLTIKFFNKWGTMCLKTLHIMAPALSCILSATSPLLPAHQHHSRSSSSFCYLSLPLIHQESITHPSTADCSWCFCPMCSHILSLFRS